MFKGMYLSLGRVQNPEVKTTQCKYVLEEIERKNSNRNKQMGIGEAIRKEVYRKRRKKGRRDEIKLYLWELPINIQIKIFDEFSYHVYCVLAKYE